MEGNQDRKSLPTIQDKVAQILVDLGLTLVQAKVYLSIAQMEKASIKDIAKTSNVVRQDIYRVVSQLHNQGLVEKIIETPTKFNAVPIDAAVSRLIERRKQENIRLQREANELLHSSLAKKGKDEPCAEDSKFIIINDLKARLAKAKKQMQNTQESLRIVTKWSFFVTYTLESAEELLDALKRGVRIQIVTQKPDHAGPLPIEIQTLMKHPHFQIKFVSTLPSSIVAIFDQREVNISIQSNVNPADSPFLLSNNLSLIELAKNFFEMTWSSALEN